MKRSRQQTAVLLQLEQSARVARQVTDIHWDGNLPVDLPAIAQGLNLRMQQDGSLAGGDACLVYDAERSTLRVNPVNSRQRQRFAIAHGLAHHCLGHPSHADAPDSFNMGADIASLEANLFALEVLMPELAVRQVIRQEDLYDVSELAQRFGVSATAMHVRLQSLDLITQQDLDCSSAR
ncbi:ImmA/IrrE family metallo-endopeptidase [Geopseudomonas aromaticivorans]